MRAIFLILILINVALFAWRVSFGLPGDFEVNNSLPHTDHKVEVGERLTLLSESKREARLIPNPEPLAQKCKTVGPFENEGVAKAFIERLAALDVVAVMNPIEESVEDGYRVYLPAETNRDAAKHTLTLLQAKGFDSYIIAKGELENGIALGVFKKKSSADSRMAELQAIGYKPLVQIITRSTQELWVVLNRGERQKISDSSWLALVGGTPALQEKEILCLDVASH